MSHNTPCRKKIITFCKWIIPNVNQITFYHFQRIPITKQCFNRRLSMSSGHNNNTFIYSLPVGFPLLTGEYSIYRMNTVVYIETHLCTIADDNLIDCISSVVLGFSYRFASVYEIFIFENVFPGNRRIANTTHKVC